MGDRTDSQATCRYDETTRNVFVREASEQGNDEIDNSLDRLEHLANRDKLEKTEQGESD